MKTAREIAEMVNHGNDVDDFERYIEYCEIAAKNALEQERARCAAIAREHASKDSDWDNGLWNQACERIALKIESAD